MDIRCQQASVKFFTKNRRKFIKILQTFDTIKITINLQANDVKINSYSVIREGNKMKFFFIVMSYFMFNILSSLSYVGFLFLLLFVMKKLFDMNEMKWNALFNYKNGNGLYLFMVLPYFIVLIAIFPISLFWFEIFHVENRLLGSIFIIALLLFTATFKLMKLKRTVQEKLQQNY